MSDFFLLAAFFLLGGLTLLSAVLVVTVPKIVHSALFLALSFVGVAALFVLLYAEFVAAVQVLIYAGAIVVLLLFAIMLTQGSQTPQSNLPNRQWVLALGVAGAFFVVLIAVVYRTAWPLSTAPLPAYTTQALGQQLFTTYVLPFEIASVLLLVAMVGAIVIARED